MHLITYTLKEWALLKLQTVLRNKHTFARSTVHLICFLLLLLSGRLFAQSDLRSVKSDFERCASTMNRTKRETIRFEEVVDRLQRLLDGQQLNLSQKTGATIFKFENRVDYFRSRIDRSAGQRDKIMNDLNTVSGATCPSCLFSSVDLYCRNSENLATEIDDYLSRASALEDEIRSLSGKFDKSPSSHDINISFSRRRIAIDSTIALHKIPLDSCQSDAGMLLWKQCTLNIPKVDSLHKAGLEQQSVKTLGLVELLLKKAIEKCPGK